MANTKKLGMSVDFVKAFDNVGNVGKNNDEFVWAVWKDGLMADADYRLL